MNPTIRGALYVGAICYFGATLVVVFNSPDVSFFALSVIFLTANFICVLELFSRNEATELVDPVEFFGEDYCHDIVNDALREFRRSIHEENESSSERCELPLSDSNSRLPAAASTLHSDDQQRRRELQMKFEARTSDNLKKIAVSRAADMRSHFFVWYGLSLLILVAYGLVVHFWVPSQLAPSFLGWIVIGAVVLIDFCVFLYSRLGRSIHEFTRMLIFAGARVSLIVFPFELWFMGHCLVYCICGIFFSYNIIDMLLPMPRTANGSTTVGALGTHQKIRYSEFAIDKDQVDDQLSENVLLSLSRTLGSTLSSGPAAIVAPYLPITLLSMSFGAVLGVCDQYSTEKVLFVHGYTSQYRVGVAAVAFVALLSACFAVYRAFETTRHRLTLGVCRLIALAQCVVVVVGIGFWYLFAAPLMVALTVFLPPIGFTIYVFIRLQQSTEFEFIQSAEFRDPPYASFCAAFWSCGLPVEDVKHVACVVVLGVLLLCMGLVISLTYAPYIVGLAVPVYIGVVFNTFIPALKYFQTLVWERRDTLQVLCAMTLHFGFMVAIMAYWQTLGPVSTTQQALLYGVSGLYVPVALLLTALLRASVDGWRMSLFVSHVLRLFLAVAVAVLIAVILLYPWIIGAAVLVGVMFVTMSVHVVTTWVQENYVFSMWLGVLSWLLFAICILTGAGVGIMSSPFWGFTASWFTCVAALLVWAYGLYRRGAITSSGAPNPTPLLFSRVVFPVFRFDVSSNDVNSANAPVFLIYVCLLLSMLWSIAAAVVQPELGLGVSALCIILAFVFTRAAQRSESLLFSETVSYVRFDVIEATRRRATELQTASNSALLHSVQLDGANQRLDIDINYAWIVAREHRMIDSLKLTHLFPRDDAGRDYGAFEYSVQQIELMDRQREALYEIEQRFLAHFVFLLVLATRAAITDDEAKFAKFASWVATNHRDMELDPFITAADCEIWSRAERTAYGALKSEFDALEKCQEAENERRRAVEELAEQKRLRCLDEADRKRADTVNHCGQQEMLSFSDALSKLEEINAQCARQGTPWCDEEFPAVDESLCSDQMHSACAVRQAVMKQPGVDMDQPKWLRPSEYCKQVEPVLCDAEHGFDINQLMQGALGDCYLISAIGVCALRKDTNGVDRSIISSRGIATVPMLAENRVMRALITPNHYNPHGAYLVRFFKQGVEIPVLIDDRFPMNGEETQTPCFVRSRSLHELWPSVIEKAYAKLHGGYEAIEAGKVHQALVDITNGASDEVRMDRPDIRSNMDSLWERVCAFERAGYLLACGSNAGSDTDSDGGIFMGHAYAILRTYCEGDLRLIELRNPWGKGEWTGEWSDGWKGWPKRLKTLLNVEESDDDRWRCLGPNPLTAVGAKQPFHNPHFKLTVTRPQTVYVQLQQTDRRGETVAQKVAKMRAELRSLTNDSSGDDVDYLRIGARESADKARFLPILFHVLDNGGERVESFSHQKSAIIASSNRGVFLRDREVTAEVELPHANEPYTIVCTTLSAREETNFTLSVFSNDDIMLEPFEAVSAEFGRLVELAAQKEKQELERDEADLKALSKALAEARISVE